MQRMSSYPQFAVMILLGLMGASYFIMPSLAWPTATNHAPDTTGPFYTGDPTLLDDTIHGRLRGWGRFDEDVDGARMAGPWGYGSASTAWDTVDMFLPAWDFGAATFTVFPEYFVKTDAVDPHVGLTIGGTKYTEVNLATQPTSYTIDRPFADMPWSGYPENPNPTDKYKNPVFKVKPGSVTVKSTPISPSSYTLVSHRQNHGWRYAGGTEVEGLKKQNDYPAVDSIFEYAYSDDSWGLGAEAWIISQFRFQFPFDDSQRGDYSMRLTINTPGLAGWQLGPNVFYQDQGGTITNDYLVLGADSISGTPATTKTFYYQDWYGQLPPSASGDYNLDPFVPVSGDASVYHFGQSVFDISWTRDLDTSPRFINSTRGFNLAIVMDIQKTWYWANAQVVLASLIFDYMAIEFGYKDTIHGQVPAEACLPLEVKLNTVESRGPSWEFLDTFNAGEKTWTIGRTSTYNSLFIAIFKFTLDSITAEYYSHYTAANRIWGMALSLNGIGLPGGGTMELNEATDRYELAVDDLDSYFLEDDPMAPAGTKHLRLQLDIVGDGSRQHPTYLYDHIIFRFRAEYTEFYAPCNVQYGFDDLQKFDTFKCPDMRWLPGSFDRYLTAASAFLDEIQIDTTHYTTPVVQTFLGFAPASDPYPGPGRVDLPLWDMEFVISKGWSVSAENTPFRLYITLDTSVPAVAPTWPTPDLSPNGIENVGWEQFEAHFVDAQSPVVAAILWWEYTSGGITHRDSLVMSGASGLALEGDAIGTIYPGSPPFETGIEFTFFMEIIDGGGNYAVSRSRAFWILQETDAPTISDIVINGYPIFPGDELVFGLAAGIPSFRVAVMDENLDPASVVLTVGGSPFSMTDLGGGDFGLVSPESGSEWTAWGIYWGALASGAYIATISAADTYPHVATVEFTLVMDYLAPECTILPPWEDGDFASGAPVVSVHILDTVSWVEEVLYSFAASPAIGDGSWHEAADYAARKTPLSGDDIAIEIAQEDWDAHVSQGNVRLSFTIRDTGGNYAPIEGINLVRDSITPNMVLIFPAQGLLCNGTPPEFRMLVAGDEPHLDSVGYHVGTGDFRIVLGPGTWSAPDFAWIFSGTLDEGDWTALANETDVVVTFFAMDRASNIDFESRTITVDKEGPRISIISPTPGSVVGGFATSFILDVTEAHPAGLWYSLDNGTTFVPITKLSDTFDQAQWDAAAGAREMRIIFRGRDALGNWGYAEVTVIRSDYAEGGLPWQVGICMAGAAGVLFAINAINKKRMGGR